MRPGNLDSRQQIYNLRPVFESWDFIVATGHLRPETRDQQWFFFFGNFCFRGNRFSEFLGEMHLGEILGLTFLGEIVLGKIFESRKFGGNELGEMLTKIFP